MIKIPSATSRKEKKSLLEIIRGKLMKNYKLVTKAANMFKLAGGRARKQKDTLTSRLKDQVMEFYERDDE